MLHKQKSLSIPTPSFTQLGLLLTYTMWGIGLGTHLMSWNGNSPVSAGAELVFFATMVVCHILISHVLRLLSLTQHRRVRLSGLIAGLSLAALLSL